MQSEHFLRHSIGPEVHWLFVQAAQALTAELYLPACTSFINGKEGSLRVTMAQLEKPATALELDRNQILNNALLEAAHMQTVPVDTLAFPGELDFLKNIKTKKHVEIVRVRHNLCHGSFLEYVNKELGEENYFFTPECCRDLAHQLQMISRNWVTVLGKFREERLNAIS